jgi:hypothetical protein
MPTVQEIREAWNNGDCGDEVGDLLTVVDQLAAALREISKRLPCDTPCENREPRGQCEVCKATDYGHWCAGCLARKALALVDPTPEPTKGEDDGE